MILHPCHGVSLVAGAVGGDGHGVARNIGISLAMLMPTAMAMETGAAADHGNLELRWQQGGVGSTRYAKHTQHIHNYWISFWSLTGSR